MSRAYDVLCHWARLTTSSFAELRTDSSLSAAPASQYGPDDGRVYRLKQWPVLPAALRTADVLRLLSLMSTRPINRRWMARHSPLPAQRVDALLHWLSQDGALEVIDISAFAAAPTTAR